MQPIEFADILSTDLQLAHTGYLTHALCLEGTATLLFNGASFPLQRGDCVIMQRSENAFTEIARTGHRYVQPMREERATLVGRSLAFLI